MPSSLGLKPCWVQRTSALLTTDNFTARLHVRSGSSLTSRPVPTCRAGAWRLLAGHLPRKRLGPRPFVDRDSYQSTSGQFGPRICNMTAALGLQGALAQLAGLGFSLKHKTRQAQILVYRTRDRNKLLSELRVQAGYLQHPHLAQGAELPQCFARRASKSHVTPGLWFGSFLRMIHLKL